MTKPLKSEWDFGELFPAEAMRRVLTVSELTASVKRLLEREIGRVWVTGEITNLRIQSSGHAYFSLKDASAQLNCVLFRGEAAGVSRDALRDGQKVVLYGDLTVYEARGQYQLRVTAVELQGVGALQIAFEKLKQKLNAEGLFAPERKRPLPRYPRRIGLITSPTGAALRDVIHVIARRDPSLEIVLTPCRVQGQGAGDEIAAAIRLLNEWAVANPGAPRAHPFCVGSAGDPPAPSGDSPDGTGVRASPTKRPVSQPRPFAVPSGGSPGGTGESPVLPTLDRYSRAGRGEALDLGAIGVNPGIDLILVTRGGGSLEDLWAFNEEVVARAIFESVIPVVSAVGHEIDFTISDFVADVRAATPSVAAELITEGVFASREFIAHAPAQLKGMMQERIKREKDALSNLLERLGRAHPRRRLQERSQRLDDLETALWRCAKHGFRGRHQAWQAVLQRLLRVRPTLLVLRRREMLDQMRTRLSDQAALHLKSARSRLQNAGDRLRLLSPHNVLDRGYSITSDAATGKVIRAAEEVQTGQKLRTRLKSGEIQSVVET